MPETYKVNTDLDIILPCYNPLLHWEENVLNHYKKACAVLPETKIRIIVVNDGSSHHVLPENIAFLKNNIPHFTYIPLDVNQGKGAALRAGIAVADSIHQIYTDIDFPFEFDGLHDLYEMLRRDEADIVSGVRGESYYATLSPMRMLASKVSQLLNRLFLKLPFNDTQSGLKGFNSKGRAIFLQTTIHRYLTDTEFLALAAKKGNLRIVPLAVQLRENVVLSKMGLSILLPELMNFLRVYSIRFRRIRSVSVTQS